MDISVCMLYLACQEVANVKDGDPMGLAAASTGGPMVCQCGRRSTHGSSRLAHPTKVVELVQAIQVGRCPGGHCIKSSKLERLFQRLTGTFWGVVEDITKTAAKVGIVTVKIVTTHLARRKLNDWVIAQIHEYL